MVKRIMIGFIAGAVLGSMLMFFGLMFAPHATDIPLLIVGAPILPICDALPATDPGGGGYVIQAMIVAFIYYGVYGAIIGATKSRFARNTAIGFICLWQLLWFVGVLVIY